MLRPHPRNPRFFCDEAEKAIYLAGSHTWASVQERGVEGQTADFDYERFLAFLRQHGHNFTRLWAWEHAAWMQFANRQVPIRYAPLAYQRTGPGIALDGKPKFDLEVLNDAYFGRLRHRVVKAGQWDIYVGVMLFQGFSVEQKGTEEADPGNPWDGHPYNGRNNVNGVDGDLDGDGQGREVHSLACPEITRCQERYVARVLDALHDQPHLMYEISNESHPDSMEWQHHMANYVQEYEASRENSLQHLVWISSPVPSRRNEGLMDGPAEVVSPTGKCYLDDPPASQGEKLVIVDTDHISPWNCDPQWVWRNLLRGNHFAMMDAYMDFRAGSPATPVGHLEEARNAMGHAVRCAERIDLAEMVPAGRLSTTGYCLAAPGREYLCYAESRRELELDLSGATGLARVSWLGPRTGEWRDQGTVELGGARRFSPPFSTGGLVHVRRLAPVRASDG